MALPQLDQDMWKAYGAKLKECILQGHPLSQAQAIFIAPLSSAGIAASGAGYIPDAITNQGVFNIGDTLLDPTSPCFIPSSSSYLERYQLYVHHVFLDAKNDWNLRTYLQETQRKAAKAQIEFNAATATAIARWNMEASVSLPNQGFNNWIRMTHPQYDRVRESTSEFLDLLRHVVHTINSPQQILLEKCITQIDEINNKRKGHVKPCTKFDAAEWINRKYANGPVHSLPPTVNLAAYDIQPQYAQTVDNWITTYTQNLSKPHTITFTLDDLKNSHWSELGFSSSAVKVSGDPFWFFTATYTDTDSLPASEHKNAKSVSKQVSIAEAGDDFKVSITFTGLEPFTINPSATWNPGAVFGMPLIEDAPAELSKPAAYPTTVLMGYGYGMTVSMSSQCYNTIMGQLHKVHSNQGSASLFGFNIGMDPPSMSNTSTTTADAVIFASSGTTITVPSANNCHPTVVAVLGNAIPIAKP